MDIAHLELGIANYVDAEVLPAIKGEGNVLKQLGVVAVLMQAKSSGFVSRYFDMMSDNPFFVALNITTQDGQIGDIDAICDSLKKAMDQVGEVKVPVIDIKFTTADIDNLKQHLKDAEGMVI